MLETKRIKFNLISPKYLKDLEELFCENHLVMKTALKGRVFNKDEFNELLKTDFITSKNDKVGFWCLTSKSNDKIIGITGLLKCNYLDKESYECGFILNENNWGKGLATEIGEFWLDYAKNEMGLTELIATVSPENLSSRKVLEKLNMNFAGKFTSKERGDRLILSIKL
jgi:ribosomal-protein-alanine N-acetyltransferase